MSMHLLQVFLWAGILFCGLDGTLTLLKVAAAVADGDQGIPRMLARLVGDCLVIGWLALRFRKPKTNLADALDSEPVSMVILSRQYLMVTEEEINTAARTVFAADWEHPDSHVTVLPQLYLVQVRGWTYGVAHKNDRYFEANVMDLRNSPEEALRRAAEEHRAWLSVDLLKAPPGASWVIGYRRAGPLLAELAGPSTIALGAPGPGLWTPWDPSLKRLLRSSDPLEAFRALAEPPQGILAENVRRAAALREARERWPEFERAFRVRRPGSQFFVLAQITRSGRTENAWLAVEDMDKERVWGRLDRDLHALQLSAGAPVTIPTSDLQDWLLFDGVGGRLGHFTQPFENALLRP